MVVDDVSVEKVFKLSFDPETSTLMGSFINHAGGRQKVLFDAIDDLKKLRFREIELLKIDSSVPSLVILLLGYELKPINPQYEWVSVAVYDPSEGKYLVVISNNSKYSLGSYL